ncbi:ABC transporter substrate-binding protein [Roseibium aggregatum]|jgi:branched-chain amino acid transport system substrate-binding protein|uniref:Hydrophobic amino acid ABC transporter (HAAT) family, amino acid-binding protein n=1 Tax=Roseibium aggregatum (strain ATCC 25650 / DSM 13394 / JCM 20685 / NBRC 16684 / NCIMB 2208 / IAM 12614 / B1) TaxID=384765 RepID=A0NSI0_ROSAI|nr:ABC transporter substrate-binding protein [Roseibium aggregatum]EAV44509.1 hydrophobic amino acid ABC transporter (HAAT) family, amino acid-binding protein [Roseibium aggregatum IAM 12614]
MKTKILALAAGLMTATALASVPAKADVKIGLLGGISGPIAAMAPAMIDAAQLAFQQVNEQGGIGDGEKLVGVVGDSACNPQNGTDAATKAVNIEGVIGVVGPHCSGAVLAAAGSVTIPAGITMITPSGTSPEISTLDDKGTVFRTVPSDDYQGRALARTLKEQGYEKVAVAYLNNDYGTGLANAFKAEFVDELSGEITQFAAHEEGKASYRSNLAELAKGGADTLVIFDYGDGTGLTILRQALENGFFDKFVGGDGMKSEAVINELGAENLATFVSSSPVGEQSESLDIFNEAFKGIGGDPDAIFATTSYDAAFLLALAVEKAGGKKEDVAAAMAEVSNGEGETIRPGEWKKAKELIAAGKAIDYKGAAGDHNFDEKGDVPGTYALWEVGANGFEVLTEMK